MLRREPGNMPLPDLSGTTGHTGTITVLRYIQSGDIKFEQFVCCVASLVIGVLILYIYELDTE
ncbi:Uncharacterised protein (plasmid) [Escherichia coli]|nr:Uncharacterised protein [Escherichia coli]